MATTVGLELSQTGKAMGLRRFQRRTGCALFQKVGYLVVGVVDQAPYPALVPSGVVLARLAHAGQDPGRRVFRFKGNGIIFSLRASPVDPCWPQQDHRHAYATTRESGRSGRNGRMTNDITQPWCCQVAELTPLIDILCHHW